MHISARRAWRCIAPLVPVFLLLLAITVIVRIPWGCDRFRPPRIIHRPVTYVGVPIVRVLLTPRSVHRATLGTTGGYQLSLDERTVSESPSPLGRTIVTRKKGKWRFNTRIEEGDRASLTPDDDALVKLGKVKYRSRLELIPTDPDRFIIVNYLDMESYLAGVLPKELYASWSPQTYRAQAIAGRTFAMYHMTTSDDSSRYDLGATQAAQVYGGFSAETEKSWDAVRSTHGKVLTSGREGEEQIFMAQYSACCGGRVNPASVIRNARDIEPLRGGQECTYCSKSALYRWKPVKIAKKDLYGALVKCYASFTEIHEAKKLRVAKATEYDRPVWIDVIGSGGKSKRLRADDLRLALLRAKVRGAAKIYSMNCKLRDLGDAVEFYDGRGFGHGVGLCQWGAQGMASGGAAYQEILSFYYPGAKIFQAY